MIDTDKYEGHTPAPWNADDDGGGKHLHIDAYGEEGDVCVARMVNGNWIDTQLIADAPLLLEELKRLQIECSALGEMIQWYMETGEMLDRDDWDAEGVE